MSIKSEFIEPIRELVEILIKKKFDLLEKDGRIGRLSPAELETAINDYGRTLISLPDAAFELAEEYKVESQENMWDVDIPLWTREEGRSDLTLSVTINFQNDVLSIYIDDLHVL